MMGAREWLNQHPGVAIAGGGGIVILAVGLIVMQVLAGRHKYPDGPPQAYYTDDGGKTFFAASSDNIPPFDHNGKQAVVAYVFQCGDTKFVGFMERYTPQYHNYVVAHGRTPEANKFGRELKRPSDLKWVQAADLQKDMEIADVKCPSGGADQPVPIDP